MWAGDLVTCVRNKLIALMPGKCVRPRTTQDSKSLPGKSAGPNSEANHVVPQFRASQRMFQLMSRCAQFSNFDCPASAHNSLGWQHEACCHCNLLSPGPRIPMHAARWVAAIVVVMGVEGDVHCEFIPLLLH